MTVASTWQTFSGTPADRVFHELAIGVATGDDPAAWLDAALDYAAAHLDAECASILAVEWNGAITCRASRGLSDAYAQSMPQQPRWAPYVMAQAPRIVDDVASDVATAPLRDVLAADGIVSAVFVPLALGSRILGQLTLYYERPHILDEQQRVTATGLAALISLAINRQDDMDRDQRFRRLIENLGVAVYTTDPDGAITFYNDEAAVLWGRRPQLGVDRWCGSARLYWPDGSPMPFEDCPMAVAMHERRPVRGMEAIAERPDGTRVTFVPYPTPVLDRAGDVIGGVNVLVDVTRRRHAEATLKQKETTLVAALTEKEQLIEANDAARKELERANAALAQVALDLSVANAAKDEFLSLVSHELKTPLTTIWGNATILFRASDEVDADSARAALGDIVSESERLHRIIENLLLLARAEQGHGPEAEPLLVMRVVERVVARHRQQRSNRSYEIREHGRPRTVVFSEAFLEQVVENLISNAEKYSPAHEPIVIEFVREDHEVRVRVLDRGIGLETQDVNQLFNPFYRSGAVQGRSEGLGIGLAVCKRLVEAQGGRVWAKSRDGGGAEFGFALPIIDELEPPDGSP